MRIETKNIYTINEHPNQAACFDWIRGNWHDLGDCFLQDMIDSLKVLAAEVGGKLEYSLSIVPDRGEHVSIKDYDKGLLAELYAKKDDHPLTGSWCDSDVIEGLYFGNLEGALAMLHGEGEYIYSDDGLLNMCEANDYEFYESGEHCWN